MKHSTISTLCNQFLALVVFAAFAGVNTAYAHNEEFEDSGILPSCRTVASDPDGDGFGWVPHSIDHRSFVRFFDGHSCIVDESTNPKPLFAQVGDMVRPLNMIRTYWDPNIDFANKELECTNYRVNPTASHLADDVFRITHYPLSDSQPWMGEYVLTYKNELSDIEITEPEIWQSAHGGYFNEQIDYHPEDSIGLFAGYWGEPIEIEGQQGMRFWHSTYPVQGETDIINGDLYQECRDTSGLPFRPTGHWDKATTQIDQVVSNIPVLAPGPSAEEKPVIYNPETGEPVELQSFSWNIKEDLLFKLFQCRGSVWRDSVELPNNYSFSYLFMPPLPGQTSGNFYHGRSGFFRRNTGKWSVENGQLKLDPKFNFPGAGWYESKTITSGTNGTGDHVMVIWKVVTDDLSPNDFITRSCWTGGDFIPTGAVEDTENLQDSQSNDSQPDATSQQQNANDTSTILASNDQDVIDSIASPGSGGGGMSLFFLLAISCFRKLTDTHCNS